MVSVVELVAGELGASQAYVDGHVEANPLHHTGWYDVLGSAFAVRRHFLAAREAEKVVGILHLYEERGPFSAPALTSLAGGALGNSPSITAALYGRAMDIARSRRLSLLAVRDATSAVPSPDGATSAVKTIVDVGVGAKTLWDRLSSNTRRKVRKAEKSGYVAAPAMGDLAHLYPIYARRMAELGTPTPGPRLNAGIGRSLAAHADFLAVRKEGRLVGGMIALFTRRIMLSLLVAVDSRLLNEYPMYLLYWRAIEHAEASGCEILDLGRSVVDSGNHRFKQIWAGRDVPVVTSYYRLSDSARVPVARQSDSLAQRLWQRLPLPVANAVGPLLRRRLPFG